VDLGAVVAAAAVLIGAGHGGGSGGPHRRRTREVKAGRGPARRRPLRRVCW